VRDEKGKKMIEDWNFLTLEEALSAANVWEQTHLDWEILRLADID
jgi:hypothetical protein